MCTVLLPPGVNTTAVNKCIKYLHKLKSDSLSVRLLHLRDHLFCFLRHWTRLIYVDSCTFWETEFPEDNCKNRTRWSSWMRHWATSRKVAGSIPGGVTDVFHSIIPSDYILLMGSNQPLTEMSKTVPLQAWSGPEGSRKLRFPDFMTTAQKSGKVVSLSHQPHLPP